MRIKKQLFSAKNNSEIWDNLFNNYLPDFDYDNIAQLEEVERTFCLLTMMHTAMINGGVTESLTTIPETIFTRSLKLHKK